MRRELLLFRSHDLSIFGVGFVATLPRLLAGTVHVLLINPILNNLYHHFHKTKLNLSVTFFRLTPEIIHPQLGLMRHVLSLFLSIKGEHRILFWIIDIEKGVLNYKE